MSKVRESNYGAIMNKYPVLKRKEERELFTRLRAGESALKEEILKHNLRLSLSVARRYVGRGLPFDDLIQEGNIGLTVAIDGFDLEEGTRFVTYATYWIKQRIKRALTKCALLGMPVYMFEHDAKVKSLVSQLRQNLGFKPSPEEIALCLEKHGLGGAKTGRIAPKTFSFNAKRRGKNDSDSLSAEDSIPHFATLSPTARLETLEEIVVFRRRIEKTLGILEILPLKDRDRTAFKLRLKVGDADIPTLSAVGVQLGITRERVRQIEDGVWRILVMAGSELDKGSFLFELKRLRIARNRIGVDDTENFTPTVFSEEERRSVLETFRERSPKDHRKEPKVRATALVG